MLGLFGILLLISMNNHLSSSREIRIGMLSPREHVRLGWVDNAAAATIAIDKAQAEGILSNYSLR